MVGMMFGAIGIGKTATMSMSRRMPSWPMLKSAGRSSGAGEAGRMADRG